MRKFTAFVFVLATAWSGMANAQYIHDSRSGPWFGGPGDYSYPVLCTACRVWQDFRNFAWNQLSINGGNARTPSNPKHTTTLRIYTNATADRLPTNVEISLEIEDVELMGHEIGRRIVEPEHFFVETYPENGDNVTTGYYPKNMGPLGFPYKPLSRGNRNKGGSGSGTASGRRGGGGDSSGGDSSGGYNGRYSSGYNSGYNSGRSGNYCGAGTEYICVQH